ncbi:CASTOR/POLLUX-related putative ion channel [Ciceribacter azotifigens]|uniref:CASTOR/POLLUX-related putative ion channel n=1 Tax=Ciceribacter azotifigens TaxID=2069303 RepID=UPI003A8B9F50
MRTNTNWRARLRYEFDKSMAAGTVALIGWLALVSLVVIIFAAAFLSLAGIGPDDGSPVTFIEAAWESLMRTMDAGTMGGDQGWSFRGVSLVVTFAGIFVFSALISVISSGLEGKLDELRKGRSHVIENDHTIILNWSTSIFDIISELVIANQSRKRARIVVMAVKDKVEMEEEIAAKVGDLKNTRIICRSGDPTDLYDLDILSPQTSRSVIVLSPETDDPDSQVIKTVLALVNDPNRRTAPYKIAAEIRDAGNAEVATIVGGREMQLVLADDLISRIVVHSSRQCGLSAVYSELLDFDGCEIYTLDQPDLVGKRFGVAAMSYDSSTLIGICDEAGKVHLNPSPNRVFEPGEKAIIIAEDDASIRTSSRPAACAKDAILPVVVREPRPERTLILGWNRRGPLIVTELARYVAPGSLLTIAADTPQFEREASSLAVPGSGFTVEYRVIDTSSRTALESLDVPSYDHVLVLGYSDDMPAQSADTRTLVTLLQLRKIAERAGTHVSVVSEMIDVRNRELAEVTRADDFVVSNKLVSLMLAQASENEYMAAIFGELLDEEGSEIYLRPLADYVAVDRPVNFHTIALSALRRGEIAIGYRRQREDDPDERNLGGVTVNPNRTEMISFDRKDMVIVLARD